MEQNCARSTCSSELLRKYQAYDSFPSAAVLVGIHTLELDWWMPLYWTIWRVEWWVFGVLSWLNTRSITISMFSAVRADRGLSLNWPRVMDFPQPHIQTSSIPTFVQKFMHKFMGIVACWTIQTFIQNHIFFTEKPYNNVNRNVVCLYKR